MIAPEFMEKTDETELTIEIDIPYNFPIVPLDDETLRRLPRDREGRAVVELAPRFMMDFAGRTYIVFTVLPPFVKWRKYEEKGITLKPIITTHKAAVRREKDGYTIIVQRVSEAENGEEVHAEKEYSLDWLIPLIRNAARAVEGLANNEVKEALELIRETAEKLKDKERKELLKNVGKYLIIEGFGASDNLWVMLSIPDEESIVKKYVDHGFAVGSPEGTLAVWVKGGKIGAKMFARRSKFSTVFELDYNPYREDQYLVLLVPYDEAEKGVAIHIPDRLFEIMKEEKVSVITPVEPDEVLVENIRKMSDLAKTVRENIIKKGEDVIFSAAFEKEAETLAESLGIA